MCYFDKRGFRLLYFASGISGSSMNGQDTEKLQLYSSD